MGIIEKLKELANDLEKEFDYISEEYNYDAPLYEADLREIIKILKE